MSRRSRRPDFAIRDAANGALDNATLDSTSDVHTETNRANMSSSASRLWDAWRDSEDIRALAEGWLTTPQGQWSSDSKAVYALMGRDPDKLLAVILGAMQLTDDEGLLCNLAAGPLENFLGRHGEAYLPTIHSLALEHRRLREMLDGVWQGSMPKRVWHRIEILKQSAFS